LFSQDIKYEKVIVVDSTLLKDEIFNRERNWAALNFNNKNNKVIIDDRTLGEISGVGTYEYRASKKYMGSSCVEGTVSFRFSVFAKDGRYKYLFHSFLHNGSRGAGCFRIDYGNLTLFESAPLKGKMIADNYAWHDVKEKTNEHIQYLISKLKIEIDKQHESSKEW
jgi:hypothetical protein